MSGLNEFKSGDLVYAVVDIHVKRNELDTIKKDTLGIVSYFDARRNEGSVHFVGHLVHYGIKGEQICLK